MPGGCCIYGVCCPPHEAKAALARQYLEGDARAADTIIESFQLVPRTLEPGESQTDAGRVALAQERLTRLHARIQNELRIILIDMGHGV